MLRHQLCEVTKMRLMSEVPLGAFLSGGVDSSSIVAMMAKTMSRPVTTCSIGFGEQEFDESDYARKIAEQFHTDHHEQTVKPNALDVLN